MSIPAQRPTEAGKAPVRSQASPLDVQGVDLGLSTEEIVSAVREARARGVG
jgi:hypothetical protein